jgi:fermentation-respiration switch protein FrsA (DUF1100 family)
MSAMLFHFAHLLIAGVYWVAPIAAFLLARAGRGRFNALHPMRRFRLTALLGLAAGAMVCVVYAAALHGQLIFSQVLITAYLATSLLLLLQLGDHLLWNVSRKMFGLDRPGRSPVLYNLRGMSALILRALVVFAVGLPYVLATALTYRPRVDPVDNPQSLYHWNYQEVSFRSIDGLHLAGWWIPSTDARKTVLLCPGANADAASQLNLVKRLLPDGYNLLILDFRAHGHSGGQLCSYGAMEKNDVLGAMRWLRSTHPTACTKVAGLGVSSGAAALLAAAADPSAEGQNIDAIAVYDTYDRLDNEVRVLTDQYIPGPLGWCVNHIGLTLASCQIGTNLAAFSPETEIKSLWPRPVLIIHGFNDEYIPFDQGQALYDSALQPKMNLWIERCDHEAALKNDAAARLVRRCFDAAQRMI